MMKYGKVCIIGHRRILDYKQIKQRLDNQLIKLIKEGVKTFYVGILGEFERMGLELLIDLKKRFKDITIFLVLTDEKYFKKDNSGVAFVDLFKECEPMMFDIKNVFYLKRIAESNFQCINHCDLILAYVDETRINSGAVKSLKMAKKLGKTIINLYLEKNEKFWEILL